MTITEVFLGASGETYSVSDENEVAIKSEGQINPAMVGSVTIKVDNIDKWFANGYNTIHGGAMSVWVDCITGLAIYGLDPSHRLSVSLNLSLDFINAGRIGHSLFFKCAVIKLGKSLAFCECYVLDE